MTGPGPAVNEPFDPRRGRRRIIGACFTVASFLATLTGIVALLFMLGAVVFAALRPEPEAPWYALGANLRELFGFLGRLVDQFNSRVPEMAGFKAGLAGSLWMIVLVALIAIPVGVGASVYLEEFAEASRFRTMIQINLANLAGVPSIVYGILGLILFYRAGGFEAIALGRSLWSGALTLSLLILPIIVIASQEALRAVPKSLRDAATALGATKWQVVRDHVIPSAIPGIVTGNILALARALGETAPLLMVGAAASITWTPNGPGDTYTVLPVEIYNYAKLPNAGFQSVAAGGILLLLAPLLLMIATAIVIRSRLGRYQ